MRDFNDLRTKLFNGIPIDPTIVNLARDFILDNFLSNSDSLVESFLEHCEKDLPKELYCDENKRLEFEQKLIDFASWSNACRWAIYQLQSEGKLYVTDKDFIQDSTHYITTGSSMQGARTHFSFQGILYKIHRTYQLNPIFSGNHSAPRNIDLHLENLAFGSLNDSVAIDLSEAVNCFKQRLFLPSIVMIGRAMEGAWNHLGFELLTVMIDCENKKELENALNSTRPSLAENMFQCKEAYLNKNRLNKPINKSSSISKSEFRETYQWCEQIRSYRNAVHPEAEPNISFDYGNTATLILEVNRHFPRLDDIVSAIKKLSKT